MSERSINHPIYRARATIDGKRDEGNRFLFEACMFATLVWFSFAGRATELRPVGMIRPESGAVAVDLKGNSQGVFVRIAGEGWRSYTLKENGGVGVYLVGGLGAEVQDFWQIPAGANVSLTESDQVRVAGAGLVLWSEDLGHEAVAFGLVGSPTAVDASSVFFSDGKSLVLRETFLGADVARLGPDNGVTAADVTTDQSMAVTVGKGVIDVWDVTSGNSLQRFEIGEPTMDPIVFLRIILGGRRVVVATEDSLMEVWDLDSGTRVGQYRPGSSMISLEVASDGATALIGHSDGRVVSYNTVDGSSRDVRRFVEGDGVLRAASLSPVVEGEASTVWTLNDRSEVQQWTLDGELLVTIDAAQIPLWPENVVVDSDFRKVAVRDRFSDRHFLYDLQSGAREVIDVDHVKFLSANRYAGWSDRAMGVWRYDQDALTLVWQSEFDEGFSPSFTEDTVEVSFNRDGPKLIRELSLADGAVLKESEVLAPSAVDVSNRIIFPTTQEIYGRLTVISEESSDDLIEQVVEAELIDASTDETFVSLDGTLRRSSRLRLLLGETAPRWVESRVRAAMSWDGRFVAIGVDNNVRVWDAVSGRQLLSKEEPMASFNHVVFSEDGNHVALQYNVDESRFKLQSVWQLGETPLAILDERFEGRVEARFVNDSIELDLDSDEGGPSVRVYNVSTGMLLEEREVGASSVSVFVRGIEPYRMRVRVLQETELEGAVERVMAVELRPGQGGSRWIRSLQGTVTSRFPFIGQGNVKRVYRPSFRGLWLEEDNLYVVGIGTTVSLWNYVTGELLGSADLESMVGVVEENIIGWRAIPTQVSVDRQRVLVRLEGMVEDSGDDDGVRIGTVQEVIMAVDGDLYRMPPGGRESLLDDRFTRALVPSAADSGRLELWEVKTSTKVALIPSGLGISVGVQGGRGVNPFMISGDRFMDDGESLLTISAEGIGIWDLSAVPPGLAIRRGADGLALVWEPSFVGDGDRLQASDSIETPVWIDLDHGNAGILPIESMDRPFQVFRWAVP